MDWNETLNGEWVSWPPSSTGRVAHVLKFDTGRYGRTQCGNNVLMENVSLASKVLRRCTNCAYPKRLLRPIDLIDTEEL